MTIEERLNECRPAVIAYQSYREQFDDESDKALSCERKISQRLDAHCEQEDQVELQCLCLKYQQALRGWTKRALDPRQNDQIQRNDISLNTKLKSTSMSR